MDHTGLPYVDGSTHFEVCVLGDTYGLKPDVVDKLKAETHYRRIEEAPSATRFDQSMAIGLRISPGEWTSRENYILGKFQESQRS